MQGVARGLSPIRDAYSGGVAYDRQTLDVHRRQLEAMRRRDEDGARGDPRRALPDARDAVREGDRPALVRPLRRTRPPELDLAPGGRGRARSPRPARPRRRPRSTSPRSSPSAWSGSGRSQRTTRRARSCRTSRPGRGLAPRTAASARRGRSRARTFDGATRSSPPLERRTGGHGKPEPAEVGVGAAVRDEGEGSRPLAHHLERVGNRPRRSTRSPSASRVNARSPGRRPSSRRPRRSIRRTSSASRPMPR